jgi:hypothetical protein
MTVQKAFIVLLITACSTSGGAVGGGGGGTDLGGGTEAGGGTALGGGSDVGGGSAVGGGSGGGGEADAGTACVSSNSQPDICGYGNFCDSLSMLCGAVPGVAEACSNFMTSNPALSWDPTLSTGPVIYDAIDETDVAADCTGTATAFTVTVYAYTDASSPFPAQKSNLPGFSYYNTSGTATDIPANLLKQSNYTVSADMLNASMKFTLCSTTATMNIQAAFAFTGGNPFCVTLHNP